MNTEIIAGHGTVEARKEVLVKDLKSVVGDADALLKEVASSTAEGFSAARTNVERRLGEAKSRLVYARLAVTEKARHAAGATNEYVKENPWRVLGVAAASGLIIGFLLSRR
ncbi:MAG TPA: DUF883 family protein [Verrucomicrobiae bacterium]|nr:DUF883 family protein [Verrucomicrobiae bacterium]